MSDLGRAPAPVALVDDSVHSARLFLRTLAGRGCRARWLGNGDRAGRTLDAILKGKELPPQLVVVDLKSRSDASADFIARYSPRVGTRGALMVALAPTLAAEDRGAPLQAGAAAVFQRHADRAGYHREIGALIEFWERNQRLLEVTS